MRTSRLAVLVLGIGTIVAAGPAVGQEKGATPPASRVDPYPPNTNTGYSNPSHVPAAPAPKPLAQEYPELVPVLLRLLKLEGGKDHESTAAIVIPALRRLGPSALPPLIKVLEGSDPEQRAAALFCLWELVGPQYPAREAIPAVMKLAKDSTMQELPLMVLTKLIAANEPDRASETGMPLCGKGSLIGRGPLRSARYIMPDGKTEALMPETSEPGAIVSVYPNYLVVEGGWGLDRYMRCIKYKELLELTFAR